MRLRGLIVIALLASAGCSDDSSAEPSTTSVPDGVNCEAGGIVAVGNETLGAILEQGLTPIGSAFTAAETQEAIDASVPPMAEALIELVPALDRAVSDLRASLPAAARSDADRYIAFVQDYARTAAGIQDVAGFEATLALENSSESARFDESLAHLDELLVTECGVTLRIDRAEPAASNDESAG